MIEVYFGKDSGYTYHCVLQDLKKENVDEGEIERFDCFKDPISDAILSASSMSLFSTKKTIIVSNCYFLSSSSELKGSISDKEQGFKDLISYVSYPVEDTDLILVVPALIGRSNNSDDVKSILNCPNVVLKSCDLPSEEDYTNYAFACAKTEGVDIDRFAIKELINRCKDDYLSFKNNLDKLFTYSKKIRKSDVELLVYKPLEDDVFALASHLIKFEIDDGLKTYKDLRNTGVLPITLLSILASQMLSFTLTRYLVDMGMLKDDIAKEMKISPGRAYYMIRDCKRLSFDAFLSALNDLADIELDIKSRMDDPDCAIEMFIALFKKRYNR